MKIFGILIASMLLFAGFCHAQNHSVAHPPPITAESARYGWADVLRVDPVYEIAADTDTAGSDSAPSPSQDCPDETPSPSPAPSANEQTDTRAAGTLIGALIGGVIGHAFGRHDGKATTTAAGAIAGGVVGNRVAAAQDRAANDQARQQADDAERAAVAASLLDCRDRATRRPAPERRIIGYDVEYRYKGEIYMARLPFDPGDRMRVKITVVPVE
jgi:uncharacterized protein YcfJ